VCSKQLGYIENSFDIVKETCFIGAIRNQIETLAQEETSWKEEQKLCEEYKCLFKAIPHVDKLSTDILAEITLKDPHKTFKTHTYPCPHKYCDAWQLLLKQHLAVGHIRPSSSPFTFPAFIISKADSSALFHQVNNYQQLH
jgi:hypothetical protein